MKIVADCHLPYVKDYFSHAGELVLCPGREINNKILRDADVLLVRSITQVNEALLKNTAIKIVASMTAGADHLDSDYLNAKNIKWTTAAGFNAPPVADYIVCLVAGLMRCRLLGQPGLKAAVVGVGHVGKIVAERLRIIGFDVICCDPYRAETEPTFMHTAFDAIADVDLVTFHVPLAKAGKYPSYHMASADFLQRQKPGCVIMNASRGAVIDTQALKDQGKHLHACLDVWENEPQIDMELLEQVLLATPHIAGYSLQSKLRGMEMMVDFIQQYGVLPSKTFKRPIYPQQTLAFASHVDHWQDVVLGVFNPLLMTNMMRHQITQDKSGRAFDMLRNQFNYRHEFSFTYLAQQQFPDMDAHILKLLGLQWN